MGRQTKESITRTVDKEKRIKRLYILFKRMPPMEMPIVYSIKNLLL